MLNCVSSKKFFGVLALLCGALLLISVPTFPQGNTGRILGTVTDQSGGYVAGANVTVTSVERGTVRTIVTDSAGTYVVINLLPGTYTVRVEAKGFKTYNRQNLLLEVGKDLAVDPVLQTGAMTESITITEEAPMVDTTSTTLGGTISNEVINDLPLNGRNYQNLITLRPGTSVYPGGGPWTQTTNGVRPEDTSYIVDGVTNDEAFMGLSVTNAAAVLGDAATLIPIDAIQEFNTQVNPKAEFGWKPGAITSVGVKSGTNEIHGTAYGFGRGDQFDARNYFNPAGTPKQPLELEQYGVTAGGHIIRDKLFWFGAFEGQLYTVGNALPGHVPEASPNPSGGGLGCMNPSYAGDCQHSIPDAIGDLMAADATIKPLSLYMLGCGLTAPYTPCTGGLYGSNPGPGTFVTLTYPNENTSKNLIGKIDYHISEHNTISGSYFFGNDTIVGMDFFELLAQYRTRVHSRAQALAAHWTWTPSSTWANDLRGGFTHYTLQIIPSDISIDYHINTGLTNPLLSGIPNVNMPGIFTELGAFHNFPKIVGPDKVFSFVDQLSHLSGKHAFKFGGEVRRDLVHQATFRAGRGRVYFGSLEDFLQGNVSKDTFLAGDPTRNMSQWLYAGYAQDDWRITPRVTLNLGIRYEFQAVPTEDHDLLGNWEPSIGFEQVGKNISSIYNPDHKNFSPRIGVAWDVTGRGTTIVRAGGSILYSLLSMSTFLSQQNTQNTVTLGVGTVPTGAAIVVCPVATLPGNVCPVAPTTTPGVGSILATGITLGPQNITWQDQMTPIYPASVANLVQCGDGASVPGGGQNPGPCNTFAMNRNFRTPYVENWTLGIQHAFSGKLSLESTYVGNHGVRLPGVVDANQPNIAAGQTTQPYAGQYPYLNFINYLSNFYGSTYHGWQNTLTARNLHGLDFVLGYTYSHALDDLSSNWVAFLPMDSTRPYLEHASGDEDIRHRFTFSITYSLPEKKTKTQLLEGWQVNTIITLQSGQPWNVNDQTNNFSGTGDAADRWDLFGVPADFKSGGQNSLPLCLNGSSGGCTYVTSPSGNAVSLSDAQTAAAWAKCMAAAPLGSALNASLMTAIANGTGGCYVSFNGRSILLPNATGGFGTMGRNIFRDTGFHNVDLSISKNFKFNERLRAQFRVEMFNVFNHPNFANPNGATSGYGQNAFADPSVLGSFGCGCGTPDQAAFNPVLGSGSNRAIQLGLKFLF
jgi:hypothetical protein